MEKEGQILWGWTLILNVCVRNEATKCLSQKVSFSTKNVAQKECTLRY